MRIITIALSLILTFSNISLVFADNEDVKAYKFQDDVTINGVIGSTERFFNVSQNWDVKDLKLNLVYTKSELLDVDYSTITVFINGEPVSSKRLDGDRKYQDKWQVNIPKELVKSGYNSISIKAYKTISDKICRDDSNTANWLVIHKQSDIELNYSLKSNSNEIKDYNSIFTNIGNEEYVDTTFVLPDKYNSNELSSIMNLSLNMGQKLKADNFKLDVKLKSNLKEYNNNIIYVGGTNDTSTDFLNFLSNDEKNQAKNKAVIKQVISPFNKEKRMILIISDNSKALKNATKLICNNELLNELNSSSFIIDETKDVSDIKKDSKNKLTLNDLGYNDFLLKGPFSQETNFDVSIPKNKISTAGSILNLKFRYAKNLDFERSLVTVYVNDKPISSKKLSLEKADNDNLEVNLPTDVLGKNYYKIKVVFNLELKNLMCVTRDTDNPWAYILDSSFIKFDFKDNNSLNFKSYPYPFIDNQQANDINVVVSKDLNSSDLSNIANIIGNMGRDAVYNTGNLNVLTDSEFLNTNKKGNLIVIGTPDDNSILKDINKDLYIKFDKDFSRLENNDKIKFLDDKYSKQLSTIQLINSPYSKSNSAIIVSSLDKNSLSSSVRYLSDNNLTRDLKGDAAVVNRDGGIQDINFKENNTRDEEPEDNSAKFKLEKSSLTFVLIAGFLFLTVITSAILLILKYRK
ncbi:MAG: cellulose biosynthesis cyclic di-GMP-binding regulatory protein BcsB [Paraclostridium bifermentans]|uniref:cellulose biosynthesis cyclic di-GMP-binding regulatory protein BcsB n=1 Tax=Paraclostridium bifermentans TaxID=1490 RepID=UPI0011DCBB64|nr:cellulose biosynthesis cyclic di-GMP-binding regulatory protein BcsB [Paraclostridium bifermentans]MBS6506896.1 cellulose biosynthesis cyclic di-GMP-binding regulatory protein BcsB [Paraclostridium bifermentans]MDU3801947.1 cellulose biosynthesis cyclic di-GMP-binding regulatory protein BcsB [Paraclostridium bifermentans]